MANYPSLVLSQFCKTPIHLVFYDEGINEDGAPIVALEINAQCNYQARTKRIYADKKTYVEVSGTCLFNGDIAPKMAEISSGEAIIFGIKRTIASGQKHRNPDGSVNYCEIDLL